MKLILVTLAVVALAVLVGFVGGVQYTAKMIASDGFCYTLPPEQLRQAVEANVTREAGHPVPEHAQWAIMEEPCAVLVVWETNRTKEPFTAVVGWTTVQGGN